MRRARRLSVGIALIGVLAGCSATKPPQQMDDACEIFREKKGWYRKASEARERWGTPISMQLAFMRHESAFDGKARPPRKRHFFGLFPGKRPSTARGYAQALDSTWEEYRRETGRRASRHDFGDAADFIGWYNARSARITGLSRQDTYRLYLAYHEGPYGYRRGTYRNKKWLLETAGRVERRAQRYREQLSRCEKDLAKRRRFLFF
jgi:hypothetical protein